MSQAATAGIPTLQLKSMMSTAAVSSFQVTISGIDRTSIYVPGSLSISSSLRSSSKAKFVLIDRGQTIHYQTGEEIDISKDGTKLFGGRIDRVQESVPNRAKYDSANIISINAVDWNNLTDRFLVSDTFTDKTQGQIIKEVVNETHLFNEGVNVSYVDDGITVDEARFDHETVSKVFDKISELTDSIWWIDSYKNLHFTDKRNLVSPKHYGSSDRSYIDAKVTKDRSDYVNRLTVKAGKDKTTSTITERFLGDGETQSWTLSLNIGEAPTIRVNSVIQVIGVRSVDKEADDDGEPTPTEFFYTITEKEISQNHNSTALSSSQALEVTYTGLFDMTVQVENTTEIASRVSVEGGTGIYEDLHEDTSIDGRDNALTRAQGLLDGLDSIDGTLRLTTFDIGFLPGQVMSPEFTEHGISGEWLIESISMSEIGDKNQRLKSQLSLRNAGRVLNHYDFWRNLEQQGREFNISENQTLQILKKDKAQFTITDAYDSTIGQPLTVAWDTDGHSHFLIGKSKIGNFRMRPVDDTSV